MSAITKQLDVTLAAAPEIDPIPGPPPPDPTLDDSVAQFVISTPVRQIIGRGSVSLNIAPATPDKYSHRLLQLQRMMALIQETGDQSYLQPLLREVSQFVDEFQSLHIDIAKLKRHLETFRDREIDLAKNELDALQRQHESILNAKDLSEQELQQQVEQYEVELQDLRKHVEVLRERELDLATSELNELQGQWGECFQTQDEFIKALARQGEQLKDLAEQLKNQQEQHARDVESIAALQSQVSRNLDDIQFSNL